MAIVFLSPSYAIAHTTAPTLLAQIYESEFAVNERLTSLFGDYKPYRDFFFQLQEFVQNDQRADVAQLIAYPLSVNPNSESQLNIENETQFLQNYDRIITPGVKAEIANQRYENLLARDLGVAIGRGAVWFSGICDDDSCQDATVKIITINKNAVTQVSSSRQSVQSLADGNYRYWNGSSPNSIVSDDELSNGVLFRFRKNGNKVVGDFSYLSTNESICIDGRVNGNTVTGIAVETGDASFDPVINLSSDSTFVNFGPADFLKVRRGRLVGNQVVRYDSAILDLGRLKRINAGTTAPPLRCQR